MIKLLSFHLFKTFLDNKWILRSLPSTIYFNFHYLPFKQAIFLPIILYKPKLLELKGSVKINGAIKTGMIKLGNYGVCLYPNSGIVFENHGGTIIFNGKCTIGNNSVVTIGCKGVLEIGDRFLASTTIKLICYHSIKFYDKVLFGWNCLVSDTDFHKLTFINKEGYAKAYDKIIIEEGTWIGMNSTIFKGTQLGKNCVIASNSLVNKNFSHKEYCLFAGIPVKLKYEGIYRNIDDDKIDYE